MINKIVIFCLMLVGCAKSPTIDDNTFYHKLGIKPYLTEKWKPEIDGGIVITIHNPFAATIVVNIDCIQWSKKQSFVVPAAGELDFELPLYQEGFDMVCSIEEGWTIKQ